MKGQIPLGITLILVLGLTLYNGVNTTEPSYKLNDSLVTESTTEDTSESKTSNSVLLSPRTLGQTQGGIDFSNFVYDPNDKFEKPDDQTLYNQLDDEAFAITQRCGTEAPFDNAYWDHKEKGIYVDVVSGEPLFASIHKYDSGTGWPSFYRPIEEKGIEVVVPEFDSFGIEYEVKSAKAQSHLGHVFDDGPSPTGLRFCVNSASLHFIPYEEMEARGYGFLMSLFEEQ